MQSAHKLKWTRIINASPSAVCVRACEARIGVAAQSAMASTCDTPSPTKVVVNMGRKGGGKKAFLKGVVAKPESEQEPTAAIDDQALAVGPASGQQQADSQQPNADNGSAATSTAHLPEITSTAQNLESESRGQLTQRHKKVRTGQALFAWTAGWFAGI